MLSHADGDFGSPQCLGRPVMTDELQEREEVMDDEKGERESERVVMSGVVMAEFAAIATVTGRETATAKAKATERVDAR